MMRFIGILGFAFALVLTTVLPGFADETQHVLSDMDLMGLASNPYSSGELPLGDGHYVTDKPRKGYIYLCHIMNDGGGAQFAGPWIHGSSWNVNGKPAVQGSVTWDNAQFFNTAKEGNRDLVGNGLPIDHATGQFPVAQSDPAYNYDRNPNSIKPQNLHDSLPRNPEYSKTPYCMGGEVGIMLTGVPLFNGFDAELRDAAAHEIQDSCNGHPQRSGQYHYHSLSSCFKDVSEKTVLGYALDGFPITGPAVAQGRYLTTANLDECHGITSEIIEDGQNKVTYHYVMTQDFPYSVSCFRGKPTRTGPSDRPMENRMPQQNGQGQRPQQNMQQGMPPGTQNGMPPSPPTAALSACFRQTDGAPCSFTTPRGDTISGTCRIPPMQSVLACVPGR